MFLTWLLYFFAWWRQALLFWFIHRFILSSCSYSFRHNLDHVADTHVTRVELFNPLIGNQKVKMALRLFMLENSLAGLFRSSEKKCLPSISICRRRGTRVKKFPLIEHVSIVMVQLATVHVVTSDCAKKASWFHVLISGQLFYILMQLREEMAMKRISGVSDCPKNCLCSQKVEITYKVIINDSNYWS